MAEPYFNVIYPEHNNWAIDIAKEDMGMYADSFVAYNYPSRSYTLPTALITPNASYLGIAQQLSSSITLGSNIGYLVTNVRVVGNTVYWDAYTAGGRGAIVYPPKILIFRRING